MSMHSLPPLKSKPRTVVRAPAEFVSFVIDEAMAERTMRAFAEDLRDRVCGGSGQLPVPRHVVRMGWSHKEPTILTSEGELPLSRFAGNGKYDIPRLLMRPLQRHPEVPMLPDRSVDLDRMQDMPHVWWGRMNRHHARCVSMAS